MPRVEHTPQVQEMPEETTRVKSSHPIIDGCPFGHIGDGAPFCCSAPMPECWTFPVDIPKCSCGESQFSFGHWQYDSSDGQLIGHKYCPGCGDLLGEDPKCHWYYEDGEYHASVTEEEYGCSGYVSHKLCTVASFKRTTYAMAKLHAIEIIRHHRETGCTPSHCRED